MFWFIVLLLFVGAGFYFYQKMMTIEREIRAEQEAEKAAIDVTPATTEEQPSKVESEEDRVIDPPVVTPEVEKMAAKSEPVADESLSLEDEILAAVANLPGMKQTDIYTSFADVNRKKLQKLLKELDERGKLTRKKKGSSFLLFPG